MTPITPQERAVLYCLFNRATDKHTIASVLNLSPYTVRDYLVALRNKLGARRLSAIPYRAVLLGVVQLDALPTLDDLSAVAGR